MFLPHHLSITGRSPKPIRLEKRDHFFSLPVTLVGAPQILARTARFFLRLSSVFFAERVELFREWILPALGRGTGCEEAQRRSSAF